MIKMTLKIEVEYNQEILFDKNDNESVEWFEKDVLGDRESLMLHSDEVGGMIGNVNVIEIESLGFNDPNKQ